MPRVDKIFTVESRGIGTPDYAAPKPLGQVPIGPLHTLTDMAEHAARLGSINTFDRRGNVLFIEDFSGSLVRCGTKPWGTGADVAITSERAHSGSFSCKLVTGDTIGDYAELDIRRPYPCLSRLGFEASFDLENAIAKLYFYARLYTGAEKIEALWWYDDAAQTWYIWATGPGNVALSPKQKISRGIGIWPTTKLVADFETGKFVRLICNNLSWDLSQYTLLTITPDTTSPHIHFLVVAEAGLNANQDTYIDDIIITQNEPPNEPA